jgi:hypothetical protein
MSVGEKLASLTPSMFPVDCPIAEILGIPLKVQPRHPAPFRSPQNTLNVPHTTSLPISSDWSTPQLYAYPEAKPGAPPQKGEPNMLGEAPSIALVQVSPRGQQANLRICRLHSGLTWVASHLTNWSNYSGLCYDSHASGTQPPDQFVAYDQGQSSCLPRRPGGAAWNKL